MDIQQNSMVKDLSLWLFIFAVFMIAVFRDDRVSRYDVDEKLSGSATCASKEDAARNQEAVLRDRTLVRCVALEGLPAGHYAFVRVMP